MKYLALWCMASFLGGLVFALVSIRQHRVEEKERIGLRHKGYKIKSKVGL